MTDTLEPQDFSNKIFLEKYARNGETTRDELFNRVTKALAIEEFPYSEAFRKALQNGFIPGGRIMSAVGTDLKATAINCFIQPVGDSVSKTIDGKPGIYRALEQAAETMRRGGGVGYDFSAIRPKGAMVKGTNSKASGPVSYMRVFDRSCETVESAGSRRGAQMGVLRVDHPDIEQFIEAKDTAGELTNFNISVGITDLFMRAVVDDTEFALVHDIKPADDATFMREDGYWVYKVIRARDLWAKIMKSTYDHAEPGVLFIDQINAQNNLQYCETIEATNPCGEQPLPSYGCCCLGSIDLTRFVTKPFTDTAHFDYIKFAGTVKTSVRMLDNVLDVTPWPLEEQAKEAAAKRRIGLGFTGLGDALIMMGYRYDDEEARILAGTISREMRNAAYAASVELAQEKGPFPLYDFEEYIKSPFIQRLPLDIKDNIEKHGIRNSHLLSIAPTGTISLAFADNASNGIEPAFSWEYTRTKREEDGTKQDYQVEDHAYRLFTYMFPGDDLPETFVSALEISAEDHAAMLATVQPYIDSAISKTVNVPADYPYEDFQNLYLNAWKNGLKGLATYRPNDITGSVLSVTPEEAATIPTLDFESTDTDKRLLIDNVPTTTLESLRWQDRPTLPEGNPAWTYVIECANNDRFGVFIGHLEEKTPYPFEVWCSGSGQPRGIGALAKSISMDMRTKDRAWLKKKLDTLSKTPDETGLTIQHPEDGAKTFPGVVAAFSSLIDYRVRQLGAYQDMRSTPVLNALMSSTEPKTNTDGTMAWAVDVLNPATGDDFVLWIKELTLPNGQRRPYSVWMSGDYPKSFVGLCKSLSLDMRVVEPAWIGAKLRGLYNYHEPQADFLAWVPGGEKQQLFPSTEAYIARLITHRYAMLGLLQSDGYPVGGEVPAEVVTPKVVNEAKRGKKCTECGMQTVVKKDGCDFCLSCKAIGSCG